MVAIQYSEYRMIDYFLNELNFKNKLNDVDHNSATIFHLLSDRDLPDEDKIKTQEELMDLILKYDTTDSINFKIRNTSGYTALEYCNHVAEKSNAKHINVAQKCSYYGKDVISCPGTSAKIIEVLKIREEKRLRHWKISNLLFYYVAGGDFDNLNTYINLELIDKQNLSDAKIKELVNQTATKDNETILHIACSWRIKHEETRLNITKLLLDNGAMQMVDKNGVLPIHKLSKRNSVKTAELLIQNGKGPGKYF